MSTKTLLISVTVLFMSNVLLSHAAETQSKSNAVLVDSLKNSTWRVTCDQCDKAKFSPYYMFLNSDMKAGYNFSFPADYDYSSYPANWKAKDGKLSIEWKHGDTQQYSVTSASGKKFSGSNQHKQEQVIERVEKKN